MLIKINEDKPFHSLQIIGRKEIITNTLYKSVELSCLIQEEILICGCKLLFEEEDGNTLTL